MSSTYPPLMRSTRSAARALALGAALLSGCANAVEPPAPLGGATRALSAPEEFSPASGPLTGLVVIVDYPDRPNPFSTDDVVRTLGDEVAGYFADTSFGEVQLEHVVVRHRALHPVSYYGGSFSGGQSVVTEVVDALVASGFDFTQLSVHPSDGTTRELVLFNPPVELQITSLSPWYVRSVPGATLDGYVWVESGLGDFPLSAVVHELGHALFRFPDLYGYPVVSNGVGAYCLYGANAAAQRVNPYYMRKMGWLASTELTPAHSGQRFAISPSQPQLFKYTNPADPTEYFLIESTVQRGVKNGPEDGLFIWHIDEDAWLTSDIVDWWRQDVSSQMTPDKHYTVSIEQADYHFDLEAARNVGDAMDQFTPRAGVAFGDFTYPDAKWWDNRGSGLRIRDITNSDGTISFTFEQQSATLAVAPSAIVQEVQSGREAEVSVTLRNGSADTPLQYEVQDVNQGFTWTDSDRGGTTFAWEAVPSSSPVAFDHGVESVRIPLPFPFTYYGKTYTELSAFAKGCISFEPMENLDYSIDAFPSLRMGPTVVCPAMSTSYWPVPDDPDRVSLLAQPDKLVLQYEDIAQYELGGVRRSTMTFQVILHADGRIAFQYQSMSSPAPYRAVVGLQNARMNRGVTVATSSEYIHDGLAVLFTPITNYRLRIDAGTGQLEPGASVELRGTFQAAGLAPGVYEDTIEVRHDAGNRPSPLLVDVTTTVKSGEVSQRACAGLCAEPSVFSMDHHYYATGAIGHAARCWETSASLRHGVGASMLSKKVRVNGEPMHSPLWRLPPKRNGGYCIEVSAGWPPWASFAVW